MLISVGGFYINKNISIIIFSMRKLGSKNAYYILCGDDHKESDLKWHVNELYKNIFSFGYRNNVRKLYKVVGFLLFVKVGGIRF